MMMQLRFYPYILKLSHEFTVAAGSRSITPGVQVEIGYEGFTGYGEASMPPYLGESVESVTAFLRQVDLNQFKDPFCMEDILRYVDGIAPGNTAAKAAVDIALHDLTGKLIGLPWYKIWGLNAVSAPYTTYTIGMGSPEVVKEKVLEVAGRFRMLKIKLGNGDDRALVRSVRSVTSLPLTVDVNQGWHDKYKALDEAAWLAEQGVVMLEQPLPKDWLDDLGWLTERSPLPVFADESVQRLVDVQRLKGIVSGINIKLMKCTGMREAWKMVNLAHALGLKVMLGCMTETSCAVSAAAQLSPMVDHADLDGNLLISNDPFRGVQIKGGKIVLTSAPGIGIVEA